MGHHRFFDDHFRIWKNFFSKFLIFVVYSSLFIIDCEHDTDSQMNMLLPMIMMGNETESSDNLMMMLMMQSMGNQPIGLNSMMPFIMMNDQDEDSSLLMMIMMNSMTGGMDSQQGFDNNFNMMMPLLMNGCDDGDDECEKKQKNMFVLMMAMQSQVKHLIFVEIFRT